MRELATSRGLYLTFAIADGRGFGEQREREGRPKGKSKGKNRDQVRQFAKEKVKESPKEKAKPLDDDYHTDLRAHREGNETGKENQQSPVLHRARHQQVLRRVVLCNSIAQVSKSEQVME
jgi:hypothetical protein